MKVNQRIEILTVDILEHQRDLVEELKAFARSLKIEFGWHYLLDITWILANLKSIQSELILDAGAGNGLMQWYLANQGAQVLSVDRISRANLPLRFRSRFNVAGKRPSDLNPPVEILKNPSGISAVTPFKRLTAAARTFFESLQYAAGKLKNKAQHNNHRGKVVIYNQNLSHLVDIQDESVDAVVSVSALEHNSPQELVHVVEEILRVLKPGGSLLATLGASRDQDWRHAPSNGWCYSLDTLKRSFDLPAEVPDNYESYDVLFDKLVHCSELRQNLAGFYFKSGDNGMPWGKWDPQYQPVGVHKIKQSH